jgi:hypothetical protein
MLLLTVVLALASLTPVAVAALLALNGNLIDAEGSTTPATDRQPEGEQTSVGTGKPTERDRTVTLSERSGR